MRALITGCAGFVGRSLTRRLLEMGWTVHGVDSIAKYSGAILPQHWPGFKPLDFGKFHYNQKDCRDWFRWNLDRDFDYTFHLAAMVGGRQMIENNPLAVADDLSIDAAYWQWAARCRPKKSVVFSSSAVYPVAFQGEGGRVSLEERHVDWANHDIFGRPDMSYGWAKMTCEYLARVAYEKHGLRSVIFRPFSGYGNDQDAAYPFPAICKRVAAAKDGDDLIVWGSGRQVRDFIHIDDCIAGVLHVMDQIDDASAVNLSTGNPTSFLGLAAIAADACAKTLTIRGDETQPAGVFYRVGDTTKQRSLGFRAKVTLTQGVGRMMDMLMGCPV